MSLHSNPVYVFAILSSLTLAHRLRWSAILFGSHMSVYLGIVCSRLCSVPDGLILWYSDVISMRLGIGSLLMGMCLARCLCGLAVCLSLIYHVTMFVLLA